jgi:hypothetical protein
MHFTKPVIFCHLFFISLAVAAPTVQSETNITANRIRDENVVDRCKAEASRFSLLDLKRLESRGYCHYKVCENKYGNRSGITRNPDVIYSIICEETADCQQVHLTVEVALFKNSELIGKRNESVPAGCVYSVTDLRDSSTVESTQTNLLT